MRVVAWTAERVHPGVADKMAAYKMVVDRCDLGLHFALSCSSSATPCSFLKVHMEIACMYVFVYVMGQGGDQWWPSGLRG